MLRERSRNSNREVWESPSVYGGEDVNSDDGTVKENAKEALNFHLNMWLYYLIAGILVWVLIGYLLLPILAVVNIVLPILAILQVWKDAYKVFRYPFIFRVL
ncbi:DUF4870 domain-containing protein [Microcystis aeruginosa]|uniref:DUF4870 domain-containing protein n=1 Tax=Microcystis aeruginosa TaxID=1126 RepID=UPI0020B15E4F|nr:DUF4870 domain-containing protein [Microcystis aeruginosa]